MNDPQPLAALLELMATLRDPQRGCPWDRQQDFASIAPYTIEEAYEVADAIARGSPHKLRDELGDLLFQVVFHARMAEEKGWFDFNAVVVAIHDKLVRRHPHVFASDHPGDPATLGADWDRHKASEREAAGEQGALAGVALALPALTRAAKVGRRAAAVGFDWADVQGVRSKLDEELAELDQACGRADAGAMREELGDLLFSVVNLARHLHIDPELALREATSKFEGRFHRMEERAAGEQRPLQSLSPDAWDALWRGAKT